MDALTAYDDDDDNVSVEDGDETLLASSDDEKSNQLRRLAEVSQSGTVRSADRRYLVAAPAVSLTAGRFLSTTLAAESQLVTGVASKQSSSTNNSTGTMILHNNPTKAVLYQPIQGVAMNDPATAKNKSKTGTIQTNVAVETTSFAEQRTNFQRSGQAMAPGGQDQVLRTTLGYSKERLRQFAEAEERKSKRPRAAAAAGDVAMTKDAQQQQLVQGSDDEAEYGVWAPPSVEEQWAQDNTITDFQKGELAPEQLAERAYFAEKDRVRGIAAENSLEQEESAQDRLVERKMAHLLPPKLSSDGPIEPTTIFHGSNEFDYKGKSWMEAPAGLGSIRADNAGEHHQQDHKCRVPLKCIHRFTGHNKGVHRIRLFPVTGHLLLSAGLDGKCKVWSTMSSGAEQERRVLRTYIGHSAAVRDVQFNHDGRKFVSASFDRYLRLWDTETGQVLQTFTNRKVPYVVQFYPHDDNFFVVGCSDNKIVTYNATSGEITQEYNHHLAPVNAIVFVEDDGTKMVTTSDDKKVLVWEWDIGVPIKYISDPSMQSIPCLVMHPSQRFFAGQSLDNTIVVFQAGNKFAMQKKKKFSGHIVSGYACEMAISPDGQFMVSGDGKGNLFFWDWKRHQILQKYRAHTGGPAICCVWHPLEPSVVFSCGWDGIIKMWK